MPCMWLQSPAPYMVPITARCGPTLIPPSHTLHKKIEKKSKGGSGKGSKEREGQDGRKGIKRMFNFLKEIKPRLGESSRTQSNAALPRRRQPAAGGAIGRTFFSKGILVIGL